MASQSYYLLQKAIYEKLTGNSALMALVSSVFDHIPQSVNFPYITIGDAIIHDFSNLKKSGNDYQLSIGIWSREAGHKQITDITEIIYGLLHNGTIAVTGKTLIMMRIVSNATNLENDGVTYHAFVKVQIFLQES